MYDGSKIDRSEVKQRLDDTMRTMLNGQAADRVLDIGTGTGMIVFNLWQGLENYVGIDPSKPAVKFASSSIPEVPGLANKVELQVCTAPDISRIDSQCLDLVVLNSVVQYFPSPEYLLVAVDAVARLLSAKQLFFGDIRSYSINRQLLASPSNLQAGTTYKNARHAAENCSNGRS